MHHVLNPCPSCGKRSDFPLTGCLSFVAESLISASNGMCPECGTRVVIDSPPPESDAVAVNPLDAAKTVEEKLAVPIVDLPLSVRCRLKMSTLEAGTLGEFLQVPASDIRKHFEDDRSSIDQIAELLNQHGVSWVANPAPRD